MSDTSPADGAAPPPHVPTGPEGPADPALALTGERTLPGIWHENYWFRRHEVAYRLVAPLAADAVVLDAGCGEGYGLALLADAGAARVVGVDLDEAVVAHARRAYGGQRAGVPATVEVHAAELMSLPLADDEVDLVASFQVIEHLHDVPGYLASLRRVARPGGVVAVATPNRLTFTPGGDRPTNPFHTIEFTADELRDALEGAGLVVEQVLGIHHGRRLRAVERLAGASVGDLQLRSEPGRWPVWLRAVVRRVDVAWFEVRDDALDASLDLVAFAREPGGPA